MKFAFFGFCPSSSQSWSQPVKASLWRAPHTFACQLFGDGLWSSGWLEGLKRTVQSRISLYKTMLPEGCQHFDRGDHLGTIRQSEWDDKDDSLQKSYGKLIELFLHAAPFRYYSAEKAMLHAVKSTLSVFLVGLYFSLRTQHRANSLAPSRPKQLAPYPCKKLAQW